MKRDNGFGTIESLLIVVIVLLLGFVGWYLVQKQNDKETQQTSATNTSDTTTPAAKRVVVTTTKLPKGWAVDEEDPTQVLTRNSTNNCFAEVINTVDTANAYSPEADHNALTIDSIKGKGYTVSEQPKTKLTIATNQGPKQVDAMVLSISGPSEALQKYAFITSDNYYVSVQLSCPAAGSIQSAEQALAAYSVNL